jgi:hypothetical protein
MRKTHLVSLVFVIGFAISMLALNLHLSKRNSQLRAQLNAEFQRQAIEDSPAQGWVLPTLKGKDPQGSPMEVNLQSAGGKKVLLVFSPTCGVCDENWPNWDKLTGNPQISSRLLPVSFVTSVPQDYLKEHRIADRPVLVALDPETAGRMRLIVTPQTILVNDGKVEHSWVSRLSDSDIRQITSALEAVN